MPFEPYQEDLEIHENPDSLVITYHGRKRQSKAFISIFIMFGLLLIMLLNTFLVLAEHDRDLGDLIFLGVFWMVTLYLEINGPSWVLKPLLDHETITITGHEIRVEKYGFRTIHRTRTFQLKGKPVFHFGQENPNEMHITFSPSSFVAHFTSLPSIRFWFYPSPMHNFCGNVSSTDGLGILDRIKAKFPQFEILKDLDFSFHLKPG
jgi:hypothetical protein